MKTLWDFEPLTVVFVKITEPAVSTNLTPLSVAVDVPLVRTWHPSTETLFTFVPLTPFSAEFLMIIDERLMPAPGMLVRLTALPVAFWIVPPDPLEAWLPSPTTGKPPL